MSKYIDRSKANDEIVRVLEHTDCKDEYIDWVLMAIEKIPTIEVSEDFVKDTDVPISEDCISREYLKSKVYDADNDDLVVDWKDIEDAPSVVPSCQKNRQVERAEGEWIKQGISPNEGIQICSLCGAMYDITAEFGYCPNCGAKMKGN